jgi:integrase
LRTPVINIVEISPNGGVEKELETFSVILSPEMQSAILEKIPEIHRSIYAFLFYQGCRIGEVRALKWDCINDDVVTYKRAFSANKLSEFTKTKKIRHNLLFPGTLAVLPERGFPLDFVFTHTYGGHKRPYQENMLNRIYREAIDKVNTEKGLSLSSELYEHSKHSWGTHYINSGLDRGVIKDLFGHTDMKTTEKYAKFKVVEAVRKSCSIEGGKTVILSEVCRRSSKQKWLKYSII